MPGLFFDLVSCRCGYGVGLSKLGHRIVCLDTDGAKIETLNQGRLPIWEPELADALQSMQLQFGEEIVCEMPGRDSIRR